MASEVIFAGLVIHRNQVCDLPPDLDPTPVETRMEDIEEGQRAISERIWPEGEDHDDD